MKQAIKLIEAITGFLAVLTVVMIVAGLFFR